MKLTWPAQLALFSLNAISIVSAMGGADIWAGQIGTPLNPVLSPLGIDPRLAITLILAF
jgi:Fe2+ transport system protein B